MQDLSGSIRLSDAADTEMTIRSGRSTDRETEVLNQLDDGVRRGWRATSPCGKKHSALSGHIRWTDSRLQKLCDSRSPAHALLEAYEHFADQLTEYVAGSFSFAVVDETKRTAVLAIDRFGIEPMYWFAESDGTIHFASSLAEVVRRMPSCPHVDQQSVFDYLYFHCVPSPKSIWAGVYKLEPAEQLVVTGGKFSRSFYWKPDFARYGRPRFDELKDQLFTSFGDAVEFAAEVGSIGAFLSGGLDSSTVCGILQQRSDNAVEAFSVGFLDDAYNELDFARLAASHFELNHHCIVATADETADRLQEIFAAYDEPFGNSSVVPTYLCARGAAEQGIQILLAGDGGDELFAGNIRYAKNKLFQQYSRLPKKIRQHFIEPMLLSGLSGVEFSPIRKLRRYVEQAMIPLPDRLQSYNHVERWKEGGVFSRDFLSSIDVDSPTGQLNNRFAKPVDADFMDRMLYLDWKYTLADNDIRKVMTMCRLAGVEARFPFLDERVVQLSMQVPSNVKLRRLRLRHFYKNAMQGFLPAEIIEKPKHGFGLPFGEWLKTSTRLQEMIYSTLSDLGKRDIVRPQFIDTLIAEHRDGHASYFGNAVWVLMSLEMWLKQNGTGTSRRKKMVSRDDH